MNRFTVMEMRYIVCDNCKGYYRLESGESLEDFAECQCGGRLRYAQSFGEIIENRNSPTKPCIHCGAETREKDLVCYNCGEKLPRIKRRISGPSTKRHHKTDINILDRISFKAVFVGFIFLVVASMIAAFGFAGSLLSSNGLDMFRSLGGYIFVLIFAIIASGLIASYLSGAHDYADGLLNGGMVGIVLAVIGAFFTMFMGMIIDVAAGILVGLFTLIIYVLVYGSITAFGGLIAVWMRNYVED